MYPVTATPGTTQEVMRSALLRRDAIAEGARQQYRNASRSIRSGASAVRAVGFWGTLKLMVTAPFRAHWNMLRHPVAVTRSMIERLSPLTYLSALLHRDARKTVTYPLKVVYIAAKLAATGANWGIEKVLGRCGKTGLKIQAWRTRNERVATNYVQRKVAVARVGLHWFDNSRLASVLRPLSVVATIVAIRKLKLGWAAKLVAAEMAIENLRSLYRWFAARKNERQAYAQTTVVLSAEYASLLTTLASLPPQDNFTAEQTDLYNTAVARKNALAALLGISSNDKIDEAIFAVVA